MAKKTKLSRKERKRRAEMKAKWEAQLASQHCKGWGFMEGYCAGTTQCASCFEVTKGPPECMGCTAEFASREERLKRDCPVYRKGASLARGLHYNRVTATKTERSQK